MEVSWLLVQQIASMVLMGLAGYGVGKLKLITGEQSRVLSCMCIYLAVPCSLMTSFNTAMEADKLTGLLLALGAAVLLHLLYLALNGLMNRSGHGLAPEEQASVIYNNAGNLILPMVMAIPGQEYVIYTSVYILVQNILMWTHGQKLMGGAQQFDWKKIVTTPAIAAILAGLALFVTGLRLPGPLVTAMEGLGSCMAPLSMLVIGILFSELDLKRVLCQNNVLFVRRTSDGQVQRAGGHQADYVVADRVMVVTGEPGKQPWMSAEGRRMYADRIIVNVENETMNAVGNTATVAEN